MKEVDAKDISKIDVEKEPKKPYVVYLPEDEANKVVKKPTPVSTVVVIGMLVVCLMVLIIGQIIEKRGSSL